MTGHTLAVSGQVRGGTSWRHSRHKRRGAFLLDAMLALFIAVAVLLATVSVFTTAYIAAGAAQKNDLAYNAARQVVENMRGAVGSGSSLAAGTYNSPHNASDTTTQGLSQFGQVGALSLLPSDATEQATVSNWNSSGTVKCVVVTVTWFDGHKTATRTLSALMGQNGVER